MIIDEKQEDEITLDNNKWVNVGESFKRLKFDKNRRL